MPASKDQNAGLEAWAGRNNFDSDPYGSLKDLWLTVHGLVKNALAKQEPGK